MSTTITFEQIHERVAAHYARTDSDTVLTPKGEATRLVYRLRHQLAALEPAARAQIIGLAVAELDILGTIPMPQPAERDSRYCFFHGEYTPDTFDCPTCPAD